MHGRCTFDDYRCQKLRRQVAGRSDAVFSELLSKLLQMMTVSLNVLSTSPHSMRKAPEIQESLIQVKMGGSDDYALPDHHWPAAASAVWHSLRLPSHSAALPWDPPWLPCGPVAMQRRA